MESNINLSRITLGEVEFDSEISPTEMQGVNKKLNNYGFEIINDHKSMIIERIKNVIINTVHHSNITLTVNYSSLLESELGKDYTYLSNLFSSIEGVTIEKYIILQKIERIKELLVYHELTLSEIAYKMGYSSVAYLSSQFKRVTGLTPSHFLQIREQKRKPLDEVI